MKKLIVIVISVFMILYFTMILLMMSQGLFSATPVRVKVILIIAGTFIVGIMGAMAATMIARLREIDKEDKDDLSKY